MLVKFILSKTNLPVNGVKQTLQLLNEDCTVPFISRYRKERTGNLDDVQIIEIVKFKEQFEVLDKRKKTILKALQTQNFLTDDLKNKIVNTTEINILEDLYLPFKKKRRTKAEIARKNGLEPLAKIIMSQKSNDIEYSALKFINDAVTTPKKALEGARNIIAEWINERTDIRNKLRKQFERQAQIASSIIKTKIEDENAQKYRDYFDWQETLHRIPSHRLLAILRAENEGYIKIKILIDEQRVLKHIGQKIISNRSGCADQLELAITDAYKRLLFPSISNEILQNARMKADESAITVFSKNLKQLLLGSPLGEKRVLAIDPGYRTGCKVVCLDAQGSLKYNVTIFPHSPKKDTIRATKKISSLVDAYEIEAIAIGNGTASRETEAFIRKIRFKNEIQVFVVSEAGASIYSASKIARKEFPDFDVTVRGSVSIGRRLQDPLAELVKIDAKSIGVGQYQHDVDQVKLKKSLDAVVENCVNAVGVNINTASQSLLSYVSGIGPKLAENIFIYRNKYGVFLSREAIKKVPRLGGKAFEQGAAFLRIKDSKNPLDDSAVHPESYYLVKQMAKDEGVEISALIGNTVLLKTIDLNKYCNNVVGLPTLKDIIKELEKPGLDIRKQAKVFSFNQNIKSITDLRSGQLLPGIVDNITNFGCFVDIGIKESGLIHVSNLSDTFVKEVSEHVNLHQQIIVKVLEVDIERKRIQLKLYQK